MPHRDAQEICGKIDAALDYVGENEDEIRPYVIHQLQEIMAGPKHITLEECRTSLLVSLVALLAPVFSQHLAGSVAPVSGLHEGGERAGKLLTLILGDGATGT